MMRSLGTPLFLLFLVIAPFPPAAHAAGARIALTPAMLTNENKSGEPAMLVDEQALGGGPLPSNPKTCWGSWSRTETYPLACILDLGRERDLGTLWLCDLNDAGRFRVQAGAPGQWHDVLRDDLRDFNRWKEFRLAERTRYLRFLKEAPGANVAEIALFEKSTPDPTVTTRTLVDEIRCGDPADPHPFQQLPPNASRVETLLGRPCRVLPNDAGDLKYFAYRLGGGKGLKPGGAYLLEVDYPEDAARSIFIQNRGCEESLGFHTGSTVGDVLKGRYTFSNAESLRLPLSGEMRTWKTLFFLHDRFAGLDQPRGEGPREGLPKDGFWVVVAQPKPASDPLSKGAAVAAIRLYEVPASFYDVPLPTLPEGLPRRHLFTREEMGDGVIAATDPLQRGLLSPTDWYEFKARRMRHLAMDTFTTDLLEFGANQGWDPAPYGGNDWVYVSQPNQWRNTLAAVKEYHLNILPYYEYCGGKGGKLSLGVTRPCVTLGGGRTYTHIAWSENADCDVTDPRFVDDVHKLLDCTIYRLKDQGNFIGAWFRQRPTHLPVSFADRCLALFAKEGNQNKPVTRDDLKKDKALNDRYLAWWLGQRHDFFKAIRDDLRAGTGRPDPFFLFTSDTSEPGMSYPDWNSPLVVTDDVKPFAALGITALPLAQAVAQDRHLTALTHPLLTWSPYEWQHAAPPNDPEHYQGDDGLMLSYTFNHAYSVGSPRALDAFRTRAGLTLIRHYSLNENEMDLATADGKMTSPLGYFVADVEPAGPYCMLAEALAMANGDPTQIGYLSSRQYNRGFFEYVRDFNLNFLALPALPSRVLPGASGDPEVVVRAVATPAQGTWLAVVNTGWGEKKSITIKLPATTRCLDAVTGRELAAPAGTIELTLRPCQLRALRLPDYQP